MTVYLLDVNLLLALADSMHVHHDAAHGWFAKTGHRAWATCPITENGFVRVASNPRYPNQPGEASVVLDILRRFCALDGHQFWSEGLSVRDLISPDAVITHNQITDVYLLGLAVAKGGKLATLDQRIPAEIVQGGPKALAPIAP